MAAVAAAAGAAGAAETDPMARQGEFSMTEVYMAIGLSSAAALTAAVSILGSAFAVGKIGAAALGSAAEHPELLTRSLLFVALAEGLAVLGFAVAMLIVMKIP
jgi:V/A-type H+-transporting ATPase subunit K